MCILLHPLVGLLVLANYETAIAVAEDVGDLYDLNEIGTLKSRCVIVHL